MNHKQLKEGITYPCYICDYEARKKSNLIDHIKSKHEGVRYPCNQCDFQALYKTNLTAHIKSRHADIRYPCDQCDYQIKYKSSNFVIINVNVWYNLCHFNSNSISLV